MFIHGAKSGGTTSPGGVVIDQRAVAAPEGSLVTVVRFRVGLVHFNLHVDSLDPPLIGGAFPAPGGPAISAVERPSLLVAFNGGFKISSGFGGFEVDGRVLRSPSSGLASFVIDANGSGHVGVWAMTS